jgi:hypothetical protein
MEDKVVVNNVMMAIDWPIIDVKLFRQNRVVRVENVKNI